MMTDVTAIQAVLLAEAAGLVAFHRATAALPGLRAELAEIEAEIERVSDAWSKKADAAAAAQANWNAAAYKNEMPEGKDSTYWRDEWHRLDGLADVAQGPLKAWLYPRRQALEAEIRELEQVQRPAGAVLAELLEELRK